MPPALSNSPQPPRGARTLPHDPKPDKALVFARGSSSSKKPLAKDFKDTSSKSSKSSKVPVSHQITNVQCKNCSKLCHTSLVCPELMQSKAPPDQIHAMVDINDAFEASDALSMIILAQAEILSDRQPINPEFILIDSQLTVDLFANLKHVQNIYPAQLPIKVHCNKGTMSTAEVADFGNTEVYVNKDRIVNSLSLFCLGQKYWITYDSHNRKGVFMVHTPQGVAEFHPEPNGLHIVDLKQNPKVAYLFVNDPDIDDDPPLTAPSPEHQLQIATIHQNFEGYTKKQVQQAVHVCRLMGMVACSSECDFQAMVRLNMLKDCPVTNNNICNTRDISGPDLASIRDKMVWQKPERVVTDYVEIPKQLSPWLRMSCLSTLFHFWSWHLVELT
jgi:hypothetical protein